MERFVSPVPSDLGKLRQPLTDGEWKVYELFDRALPKAWEIYLQPHLNGLRPDFVLLPRERKIGSTLVRPGRQVIVQWAALGNCVRSPSIRSFWRRNWSARLAVVSSNQGPSAGVSAARPTNVKPHRVVTT